MSRHAFVAFAAVIVALASTPARPNLILDFLPGDTFSGTAPTGSLTATFADVTPGTVNLTLQSNLAAGEFVLHQGFYFNLNPVWDPSSLNFSLLSDTGGSSGAANVQLGTSSFKPDGDGYMDIELSWSGSVHGFQNGEQEVYKITGIPSLTSADFNYPSDCSHGCSSGAHIAAVHVGNGSDSWVGAEVDPPAAVAEPGSLALFGTALLCLGFIGSRFRRPAL